MFSDNIITHDGMLKAEGDAQHNDFISQMPSLLKLCFDGQYHDHIQEQYQKLKTINPITKSNLLRENDNMEEDEWREKVYRLKELVEDYKQLAYNNDPDEQDSPSDDEY